MTTLNSVFRKDNTIHYTHNNGRTHLSVDDNYFGSVSSYQNCLTWRLAKLFNKSIDITINNKPFCFNKKSYEKWLERGKDSTIHYTHSRGRTHLALEENYLGSVNSYHNCVTRCLAKLFNKSIDTTINHKKFSFNKKSYIKMLNNRLSQSVDASTLNKYKIFNKLIKNCLIPVDKKIHMEINQKDALRLNIKLIEAMKKSNTTKALMLIGKGASLETPFVDDDDKTSSVFKGTPLVFSVSLKMKAITDALVRFGADQKAIGLSYKYYTERGKEYSVTTTGTAYDSVTHWDCNGDTYTVSEPYTYTETTTYVTIYTYSKHHQKHSLVKANNEFTLNTVSADPKEVLGHFGIKPMIIKNGTNSQKCLIKTVEQQV